MNAVIDHCQQLFSQKTTEEIKEIKLKFIRGRGLSKQERKDQLDIAKAIGVSRLSICRYLDHLDYQEKVETK